MASCDIQIQGLVKLDDLHTDAKHSNNMLIRRQLLQIAASDTDMGIRILKPCLCIPASTIHFSA